ncbi:glycosyltransferase [Phocaeicola sp. KGMB11183]|uniref:Glycosyltransferase n=1 Tax=Phocaeicola acetigenes TaxID=3016083 RepID=A0ABT4PK39_9BACT|nr:glycosyltransferase [Phocaeicola sp. KGMB11183]MCZ8373414.1 glycosyltransferase [Phocaeicola sp. KGMB11183]
MKRIIICAAIKFPRGSAASNYLQYFSMALIESGYEVILLAEYNENENQYYNSFINKFQGKFSLININTPRKTLANKISYHLIYGIKYVKVLKKVIRKDDSIIIYSDIMNFISPIIKFAHKNNLKVGNIIVEWYERKYLKNPIRYFLYKKSFKLREQADIIFPISTFIERHFKEKGCNTFVLPILSDPYEYERFPKPSYDKINIVYPGNGLIKDSFLNMINAIEHLNSEQLAKLNFHIKGVKKQDIINKIGLKRFERISPSLIFYGWMNYDELVELYRKSHYLLLAREICHLTKANFPSKVPEVMCHGVVPIASEVGDYTQFYLRDGENAIIMKGNSTEVIKDAIIRCLNIPYDKYNTMSNNAYNLVCNKLSYKVWGNKLKNVLNHI